MLEKELAEDVYVVVFTKKNGEIRKMVCTLREEYLPTVVGTSKTIEGLTTVFDLENQGWRSFRDDSVIEYYKMDQIKDMNEAIR